jgi:hypothetical protein
VARVRRRVDTQPRPQRGGQWRRALVTGLRPGPSRSRALANVESDDHREVE